MSTLRYGPPFELSATCKFLAARLALPKGLLRFQLSRYSNNRRKGSGANDFGKNFDRKTLRRRASGVPPFEPLREARPYRG